jgi:hypothetical protein
MSEAARQLYSAKKERRPCWDPTLLFRRKDGLFPLREDDDLDDLVGVGIDNADLVADDEVAIAAVRRDNDDDVLRDGTELDGARHRI